MEVYNPTLYLTILFQLILNIAFGQTNDNSFSNGLSISEDSLSRPFSILDKDAVRLIKFSYKNENVIYYAFDYTSSDSTIFSKIKMERLSMENCSWKNSKKLNKYLTLSFIKDDHYYLLQFCPCGGVLKGRCGRLAIKINKWLEKYKTEHNKV